MQRTFERRYSDSEASRFRYDGMTDRQITRKTLQALGIPATEATIDECLALYVELLAEEVELAQEADYRLHHGISDAIKAARERGHAIGLGTGNVLEGARIKLERVGVYTEFAFGGFGNDAEDRTELLRHGAERGAAKLGVPLSECRVVVIGDTPKDVEAARGIGAESLAVATGTYGAAELRACGATYVFDSLAAPGALAALLGE
jgi:phosphoglycolate phosphatase-like HAD superfamily hydrolase